MLDISKLNDKRLKAYKISAYKQKGTSFEKCECCNEIKIIDVDAYEKSCESIRQISIEQMRRKQNGSGSGN